VNESLSKEHIRQIVGAALSDQDAEALAGWYAGFSRGVAAFPAQDLKRVEPPLRSTPGPVAR
jgi:hypothetical protein